MNYPKEMANQVIKFYKTSYNSFSTMVMLRIRRRNL